MVNGKHLFDKRENRKIGIEKNIEENIEKWDQHKSRMVKVSCNFS